MNQGILAASAKKMFDRSSIKGQQRLWAGGCASLTVFFLHQSAQTQNMQTYF